MFGGINLAFDNKLPYFSVPEVFVGTPSQSWSLAGLSSSEAKIYLSLLWQASLNRSNTFDVVASKLRRNAGIKDARTFTAALNHLEQLSLVTRGGSAEADFRLTLNNPTTGEPVRPIQDAKADPANYRIEGSTRFVLNQGENEDREKQLLSFLPPFEKTIRQKSGDITIRCPFHNDSNPSCSVSLDKRCFHCFGCDRSGTFLELLVQLKGGDGEAVMRQIAARRGEKIIFRDPDSNAEAIYEYKDTDGELIKQVLRFVDDNGNKYFRQRGLGKTGWRYTLRGVPPTLYHQELLKDADVVVVTEGEKDADAITNCWGLRSANGKGVVGVTSGGTGSWKPQFADLLKEKRVIVMPDSDEAGAGYRDSIIASLQSAGVPHRVVEFGHDGCKDVSDFLKKHSVDELAERIGTEWVKPLEMMPDGEIRV
jgi:5S rRNA maturation endonuclease (ribonuclease M5)